MSKWDIGKEFSFCYGHRVWLQSLDPELSCNSSCKCRHQHGHEGTITIHLEAEELNEKGMVMDFVELSWFKKWLDETLDHKMILDVDDPSLRTFYPLLDTLDLKFSSGESVDFLLEYHQPENYFTIWPDHYFNLPNYEKEIYEGLVMVHFVPTSENLSKWLFDIVQAKLEGYAKVSHVEFYETPKSKSVYYG